MKSPEMAPVAEEPQVETADPAAEEVKPEGGTKAEQKEEEAPTEEDQEKKEQEEKEAEEEDEESRQEILQVDTIERQAEALENLDERVINALDPLEFAAARASKSKNGIPGAEGTIRSIRADISMSIKSIQRNLESQSQAFAQLERNGSITPSEARDRQERLIAETQIEYDKLAKGIFELEKGAEDMSNDFYAAILTGAMGTTDIFTFENVEVKEPGKPLKKAFAKFMDREASVAGGAGFVSKAVGEYAKKMGEVAYDLLPDREALSRMNQEVEDREASRKRAEAAEAKKEKEAAEKAKTKAEEAEAEAEATAKKEAENPGEKTA